MISPLPPVFARPTWVSTVTPGKLATFCRRPVRRLKSVDLPEFGGPTSATTCGVADCARNGGKAAAGHSAQSWQALMRGPRDWRVEGPDAGTIALRSPGAGRSQSHRRGTRGGRLRERYGRV